MNQLTIYIKKQQSFTLKVRRTTLYRPPIAWDLHCLDDMKHSAAMIWF